MAGRSPHRTWIRRGAPSFRVYRDKIRSDYLLFVDHFAIQVVMTPIQDRGHTSGSDRGSSPQRTVPGGGRATFAVHEGHPFQRVPIDCKRRWRLRNASPAADITTRRT